MVSCNFDTILLANLVSNKAAQIFNCGSDKIFNGAIIFICDVHLYIADKKINIDKEKLLHNIV